MNASMNKHACLVTLDQGERVRNESDLFFKTKVLLNAQGHDLVKKCPGDDGHLTGAPYYLRERKGRFCVYDNSYALRCPAKELNRERSIELSVLSEDL